VNPYLAYASSYVIHRPPVRGLVAELRAFELMAGGVPRLWLKGWYFLPRTSDPE